MLCVFSLFLLTLIPLVLGTFKTFPSFLSCTVVWAPVYQQLLQMLLNLSETFILFLSSCHQKGCQPLNTGLDGEG